jgi:hypothetical protein
MTSFCISLEVATDEKEEISGDDECPTLECDHCRHGYVKDSQGCTTCECIEGKNIEML